MRLLNVPGGMRRIADAVIRDPIEHTVMDEHGAVRSIQAADISMPEATLASIWTPMHLERLARTYWRYLSRVTLGLIRVVYTPTERMVVLIARPLVLLRFRAPEYKLDADRGVVRWSIRDGLLVASEGHEGDGYLEIDVRRLPGDGERAKVHIEIEIASFYPAIALRIARWFYAQTPSRIHVMVTHGFLRSLADLELEESAVGRFANGAGPRRARDTPWPAVGVLAGVALLVLALRRRL
jgi:hypothetical protein